MAAGVSRNLSEIRIDSSSGAYGIKFDSFSSRIFDKSFFLVDEKLRYQLNISQERSVFVKAEELNKTLGSVEDVMVLFSDKGMTKNDELVVIGGGYVQDIGTLVASLYMRGIEWIYVPTTLASMGDSCIGGKSSINAGNVKNLVGNFYPPKEILIDPSFISTLPKIEVVAGISEIIKICFSKSFETFSECSSLISTWQANANFETMTEIIRISLTSKKYFIEIDEFDLKERKLLNFGHSFGHALESASDYKIPHGVAVLLGMVAAASHPLSEFSQETQMLVKNCLTFALDIDDHLINEISRIDYQKFSLSLSKDKKNTNLELVLILPMATGLQIVKIPFDQNALEVATDAMKAGIERVLNEIR